jgi:hypothetical protein
MKNSLRLWLGVLGVLIAAAPLGAQITNGGFESGDFVGWTAEPNWVIADDSRQWYSRWQGKHWAWSGGQGEAATGKLRSKPFVLDQDFVRVLIAGWNYAVGDEKARRWNYVTLNLADDGREIDLRFVPAFLNGSGHRGAKVYLEAVDDSDQGTYSMFCVDGVQTTTVTATAPLPSLPAFDPQKSLKLEDDRYLVEVDRSHGAITRIRDKKGGVDLIREPRLADNFRFTLPIPGKESWQTIEANYLWGNRQKLSAFEAGAKKLTLRWNKPLVNYLGEKYDVSAAMGVELIEEGVLFTLKIDNATPYQIGEVFFPIIGGIPGMGNAGWQMKSTLLRRPVNADAVASEEIFRVFTNMSWLGDQGPERFYAFPQHVPKPWMEFSLPMRNQSISLRAHDPSNRPQVLRLELIPGNSGVEREDGNWPRPNELKGQPVGVSLCFVVFANHLPGKAYQAPPVVLRAQSK